MTVVTCQCFIIEPFKLNVSLTARTPEQKAIRATSPPPLYIPIHPMFVFKKAEREAGDRQQAAQLASVALTACGFFLYLAIVRAAPTVISYVRGY